MQRLLNRLIPRTIQLRRMEQHERSHLIPGVPKGLSLALLQEVGYKAFCSTIKGISHSHLSGWKRSGAYRLFLRLDSGAQETLVYKVACYGEDEIPALQGLPVRPGLPEFVVLGLDHSPVREFLPTVYWSQELQAGKAYRYLCEDLGVEHYLLSRLPREEKGLLVAAEQLPSLHRALESSLGAGDRQRLLRFDREYSVALLSYAHASLRTYEEKTSETVVRDALNQWPEVKKIYHRDEYFEDRPEGFIHGDFNPSNIYISKNGKGLRVVDWEWAGYGVPHADLVSLLKGCNLRIQNKALERFAKQLKGLSLLEHKRWFHWCRLERGLLDASFLARQQLESKRSVDWIPDKICQRIREVLGECQELA